MAKNTGTTAPADPNVSDAFDDATGADFVRISDVDGRAMVVWATERKDAKGNDGKPYEYVQAEVIVLDGEDSEKFAVGELIDMRFSTPSIVTQLKKNLINGRPRLGRVSSMKSKFQTRAYALDPVEGDDPCRSKLAQALKTREAAHVAAASSAVDEDPFSS